MKKHWTHYLSEAGQITKEGDKQMFLSEKIKELQKQLSDLEEEYKQNETDLHKTALKAWTWKEIDEAKAECYFMNLSDEEKQKLHPETKESLSNLNPVFKEIFKNLLLIDKK